MATAWRPATHLPPLLFDDDQAVALAIALQTAAVGTTVAEDAARALATLRQVMPPRLRHRIDLLRVTAVRPPAAADDTSQVDAQVLLDLSRAIHAREELRFDYAPGPGGPADDVRRVQPHHLVTWHHRWYLVAWDLHREDWRTFRADRVRPRTPTGPRFEPRELPGGNVSTFVTSRFRGNDGTTTDWPCRGEAVLHLPAADVAPFAQDGIVEELGPHHCRLHPRLLVMDRTRRRARPLRHRHRGRRPARTGRRLRGSRRPLRPRRPHHGPGAVNPALSHASCPHAACSASVGERREARIAG